MSGQRIVEGIFAINKPAALTSAQVLRELQHTFNASQLFAPWLAAQEAERARESNRERQRRRGNKRRVEVKIGHGGTLDPLATGVLIVGVGRGTKSLSGFLECTKSYEAAMLFGASSDTYDISGRRLATASYQHVSQGIVEAALDGFRGEILQRPPLYSALRVQGKRLYEYAREGKEVPIEIKERPVRVDELRVLEWLDAGGHSFSWPKEDVPSEDKAAAKMLGEDVDPTTTQPGDSEALSTKRKRSEDDAPQDEANSTQRKAARLDAGMSPRNEPPANVTDASHQPADPPKAIDSTCRESTVSSGPTRDDQRGSAVTSSEQIPGSDAPVAKLSMTVSSGFYVRSLCHDLGKAVGSLGLMASLVRTRQERFELGKNVLEYEDLSKGEEVWGPKVLAMLDKWTEAKQTHQLKDQGRKGSSSGAADA